MRISTIIIISTTIGKCLHNPCLSERIEFNVLIDDQHSIDLIETPERTIVKITDLLGREISELNQIVIIYYSDNSFEKRILSFE